VNQPAPLPLRDIHLPGPVSWWPPAPGWWLLAGLLLALAVLAVWWLRRRRRLRLAAVTLARRELEAIEAAHKAGETPEQIVQRLSVLLRRVCISLFPRDQAAGLTGREWLEFLDQPLQRPAFSEGPGRLLAEAPYRPSVPAQEIAPLLDLTREWLAAVSRQRGEGGE
jgi:hypothetical protein